MKKTLLLFLASVTLAFTSSRAETVFALTSDNRIFTFDSATPGTVINTLTVTGLQTDELLVGIDFRPFSGGLYALGSTSRLYLINAVTGAATALPASTPFQLVGASFGFDFNPTVDRIRVVSDQDQNLRLNPNGALAATDGALAYAAADVNNGQNPNVVASAYTNSMSGATSTTLYDIDSDLDVLAIQNPPNNGTLNTVGPLGVNTGDNVGFDISPTTGVAYASLEAVNATPTLNGAVTSTSGLYTINLSTGAATLVGPIADTTRLAGESIVDIALPTVTRLLNLSTRGRVGTGNDVLIGGFISGGFNNTRFLLRGIGPSLPASAVGMPLADPVLTLVNNSGTVVKTNDDYKIQAVQADLTAINASGLAPTNDAESAIFADLAPGPYTAILTGKNGATGVALVEIYQLP